jgi:hypothetical protein
MTASCCSGNAGTVDCLLRGINVGGVGGLIRYIHGSELRRIQNTLAQAKSLTESKHAVRSLRERLIQQHRPQLLQTQPKDVVGHAAPPDLTVGELEGPRRALAVRATHVCAPPSPCLVALLHSPALRQ